MKQNAKHLSILLAFSLILGSILGTNASAVKKISIAKKVSVTAGKTKKIKLKNNKKKVSLNKKSGTLTITNKKTAPTTTIKVKNVKGKTVKWTTSNKKVATVKATGKYKVKVTAKKAGKANITCKVNGKKLVCKITVKDNRKTNANTNASSSNTTSSTSNTSDTASTSNTSTATPTPTCNHEWAEKWAVYESEGDYDMDACVCYCGRIFDSEEELTIHLWDISVILAAIGYTDMERETGIHGTRAIGTPSISIENDIKHIAIKRNYIEYYYCTKCGTKLSTWDLPR